MTHSSMEARSKIPLHVDSDRLHGGAFEIVLGAYEIEKSAKKLLKFQAIVTREEGRKPSILCVICGMSNFAFRRTDDVHVLPITALKD